MPQPPTTAAIDETPINRDWIRVVWWFVLINFGLETVGLVIGDVQMRRLTIVPSGDIFRSASAYGLLGLVHQAGQSLERFFTVALFMLAVVMLFAKRGSEWAIWILVAAMAGEALRAVELGVVAYYDPGLKGTLMEARVAIAFLRFVALAWMLSYFLRHVNTQPTWVRIAGFYLLIAGAFGVSLNLPGLIQIARFHRQSVAWEYHAPSLFRGTMSLMAGWIVLRRPLWRSRIFGILLLAELAVFGFGVSYFVQDVGLTAPFVPTAFAGTASAFLFLLLSIRKGEYWSPLAPRCRGCGYSLVGLPGESERCPECGRAIALPLVAATT